MNLAEYKYMTDSVTVNPFGIPIAQTWNQIGLLFEDINKYKITFVAELGTYLGGLSELLELRANMVGNFDWLGVDIDRPQIHARMRHHSKMIIGSAYDGGIIGQIAQRINANQGVAMVFCDTVDKQKDMITYAPILRVGDYIRPHDYPGETTAESLAKFGADFPYMREIEPEKYRELGTSLWKREA